MDFDGERFRQLIDSTLKLLILYEEELTAYHLVTKRAKEKIPSTQFDFDGAFRRVMSAPGLHVEAEAEYAELEPLKTPEESIRALRITRGIIPDLRPLPSYQTSRVCKNLIAGKTVWT